MRSSRSASRSTFAITKLPCIAAHHASAFAFEILAKLQLKKTDSEVPGQDSKQDVLDLLNRLLPSQFDAVVFRYGIELAHLSNGTQTQRGIDRIQYTLQKEGADLSQLVTVIYAVAPHLKKR